MKYNVVVVGASGQVGAQVMKELEERAFPVNHLLAFASERSVADIVEFGGEEIPMQVPDSSAFAGADIVFFCTPSQVTEELLPMALEAKAFCIDLSTASLADSAVPCIVPELSSSSLLKSLNPVVNPPVSVIQAALILNGLNASFGLAQVSLNVLQSASALGGKGVEVLRKQSGALLNGRSPGSDAIVNDVPAQLAFNLVPLLAAGEKYSDNAGICTALRRLLADTDVKPQVEIVQSPVFYANGLSIACRLDADEVDLEQINSVLQQQDGIELFTSDCMELCGTANVPEHDNILACVTHAQRGGYINIWSAIDNLRKGSALNAVQIAEMYIAD